MVQIQVDEPVVAGDINWGRTRWLSTSAEALLAALGVACSCSVGRVPVWEGILSTKAVDGHYSLA